jgi:hypothetical protein
MDAPSRNVHCRQNSTNIKFYTSHTPYNSKVRQTSVYFMENINVIAIILRYEALCYLMKEAHM